VRWKLTLTLAGSHPFVIFSLTTFAVFFPLFLYVETHAVQPIMPMHLVRQSPHRNLLFSNHIAAFISNAIMFNVPLFFQAVLLTSATTSGLRLVICSAVTAVAGIVTGFLITYTRHLKWPLVLGSILSFLGTFCLASMQRGWPTVLYLLCLVVPSAGQGFQFPVSRILVFTSFVLYMLPKQPGVSRGQPPLQRYSTVPFHNRTKEP